MGIDSAQVDICVFRAGSVGLASPCPNTQRRNIMPASPETLSELKTIAEDIKSLDSKLVMRNTLGNLSLEKKKGAGFLDDLNAKCEYYIEWAPHVSDEYVKDTVSLLGSIYNDLVNLNNATNDQEYVQLIDSFVEVYDRLADRLSKYDVHFEMARIRALGLLKEDALEGRKRIAESLLEELDSRMADIKKEAEQVSHTRNILVGEATEGSFTKAIEHFDAAQTYLDRRCQSWWMASIASVAALVMVVLGFVIWGKPDPGDPWANVIYNAAIRLTLLGVLGAFATFCLRAYRSHIHMSRYNHHRKCIAECMDPFVHAAVSPEQKDKILSILVESVASFGASGLIQDSDDHMTSSKLIVEQFGNMMSSKE